MGSEAVTTEKAYSTSEIAVMLDIAVPTVRKYARQLESSGYEILKSKSNARLFVEKDIMVLRYLKELRGKSNITVEQAANVVLKRFDTEPIQTVAPSDTPDTEQYSKQYDELKKLIIHQNEQIEQLHKKIDKQHEYIEFRLNERDKVLMKTISERLETQKQIATAEAKEKANEKKSFFNRLFKK
ncbi:hypothetical protein CIL05_15135 [Virgibacillus profundi]|uniref:Uncharacterized protein n=1 Tax=Virgibacillus profundi TaxID=2024555 RepID=A0A2A2IAG4_9BACI|nr:MerR family transcriptional regulator [Virgibacillus profundi]PAV28627.1 hypothetical protein CIL05_15135 [Virgibacillus profundi]PXY52795.1 hypothetical protein CIT14_15260 [Virgibacillus profundi]